MFSRHLHLAHLADSSLPGNLMADFVRGNPQGDYPAEIIDGIFMHERAGGNTDVALNGASVAEWHAVWPRAAPLPPVRHSVAAWRHSE